MKNKSPTAPAPKSTTHPSPAVEIAKQLFGDHPKDVIGTINTAADALGWLEQIFITIKKEALIEYNGYRIQKLAEVGAYLASDMSELAGHQYDIYNARLQEKEESIHV